MVIDFHTHIFPPVIRESREKFFPSEPAFELLYRSSKSRLVGVGQLLEAMDENGVDKSVVFGFPWKNPETVKRNNDYIMEVVARYPDRFVGLGCFEPSGSHAAEETDRCLNGGLSGIGELAFPQPAEQAERDPQIGHLPAQLGGQWQLHRTLPQPSDEAAIGVRRVQTAPGQNHHREQYQPESDKELDPDRPVRQHRRPPCRVTGMPPTPEVAFARRNS